MLRDEAKQAIGYLAGGLGAVVEGATELDGPTVEAYLTSHFYCARMLHKRFQLTNDLRDLEDR